MASVIDNVYDVPGISSIFSCNHRSSWLPALSSRPIDLSSRLDVAGIHPFGFLDVSVNMCDCDHLSAHLGMFVLFHVSFPVANICVDELPASSTFDAAQMALSQLTMTSQPVNVHRVMVEDVRDVDGKLYILNSNSLD